MGTQVSAGCRSIYIPSGNLLHSYWKWPIEIVDLPIKNGDVPQFFVCLPGRVVQSPKKSLCSLADLPSNVRKSIRRHSWQPAHEFLRRETLLWWIVQLRPRWLQNGSANGDVHTNPNIVKHRQSESIRINQTLKTAKPGADYTLKLLTDLTAGTADGCRKSSKHGVKIDKIDTDRYSMIYLEALIDIDRHW